MKTVPHIAERVRDYRFIDFSSLHTVLKLEQIEMLSINKNFI
jgi:hypothetical protein